MNTIMDQLANVPTIKVKEEKALVKVNPKSKRFQIETERRQLVKTFLFQKKKYQAIMEPTSIHEFK